MGPHVSKWICTQCNWQHSQLEQSPREGPKVPLNHDMPSGRRAGTFPPVCVIALFKNTTVRLPGYRWNTNKRKQKSSSHLPRPVGQPVRLGTEIPPASAVIIGSQPRSAFEIFLYGTANLGNHVWEYNRADLSTIISPYYPPYYPLTCMENFYVIETCRKGSSSQAWLCPLQETAPSGLTSRWVG